MSLDVILGPGRSFKGRQEDHQKTISHHKPPQIDTAGENRIQDKCQDGKLDKGPDRTDDDGAFDIQSQKKRNDGNSRQWGHRYQNIYGGHIDKRFVDGVFGHGQRYGTMELFVDRVIDPIFQLLCVCEIRIWIV